MYGYVIFTDIEKYSTLKDADLKIYYSKVIPVIFQKLQSYKDSAVIWNTWGDAIVAVYEKAEAAINMALAYRDVFKELDFEEFGIKKLRPRIAGNFGEFEMVFDQVSGKENIHGTMINLAARIEPVTLPGEIFVTKEFRDMACSSYDKIDNVRFDDMGEIILPKNAGDIQLYRLCKKTEEKIKPTGTVLFPSLNCDVGAFSDYKNDTVKKPENNNVVTPAEKSFDSLKYKLQSDANKNGKNRDDLIKNESNKENFSNKAPSKNKSPKVNSLKKETFLTTGLQKKKMRLVTENPFFITFLVFAIGLGINYLLELQFIKDIFDWVGYYINYAFYWLSLTTKTPGLTNPVTPQIMAFINPWMWLRGFIASSFIVGQCLTILHVKTIKGENIFAVSLIVGICRLVIYYISAKSTFSLALIIALIQQYYIDIIAIISVCFAGLLIGTEYALYLFRNGKINIKSEEGAPSVSVQFTHDYEWNK